MSYGVIKSLETLRARFCSNNPLDCVTTYTYRAFTHKIDIYENLQLSRGLYFFSIYSGLFAFYSKAYKPRKKGTSTHIFKATYRTFTHIFTVLSPMFSSVQRKALRYLDSTTQELALLESETYTRTTALSPIKVPLFHTCDYRTYAQGSTVLSNMNFTSVTVLSPIKSPSNLLNRFTNSIRKVDLKLDHKKIISLDDVLFFEKQWGRRML